eukprot:3418657-Prymnesium_polylepis.1
MYPYNRRLATSQSWTLVRRSGQLSPPDQELPHPRRKFLPASQCCSGAHLMLPIDACSTLPRNQSTCLPGLTRVRADQGPDF